LIVGAGFEPNAEPRPVVNTTTLQPDAICPVTEHFPHDDLSPRRCVENLIHAAEIEPGALGQNRCFARSGWDREVRMLCRERGICYQGFSLLTANPQVLEDSRVHAAAEGHTATPAQIVFAFARAIGMVPLTGTTDAGHMAEDLAALDITLEPTVIGQLGG